MNELQNGAVWHRRRGIAALHITPGSRGPAGPARGPPRAAESPRALSLSRERARTRAPSRGREGSRPPLSEREQPARRWARRSSTQVPAHPSLRPHLRPPGSPARFALRVAGRATSPPRRAAARLRQAGGAGPRGRAGLPLRGRGRHGAGLGLRPQPRLASPRLAPPRLLSQSLIRTPSASPSASPYASLLTLLSCHLAFSPDTLTPCRQSDSA